MCIPTTLPQMVLMQSHMAHQAAEMTKIQMIQTSVLEQVVLKGIGSEEEEAQHRLGAIHLSLARVKAGLAATGKLSRDASKESREQLEKDTDILKFHRLDMMSNTPQGEAFKDDAAEKGDYDEEPALVDTESSSAVYPGTAALPAVSFPPAPRPPPPSSACTDIHHRARRGRGDDRRPLPTNGKSASPLTAAR
jgi:hypothetical protein